jgi:hypothetical protein
MLRVPLILIAILVASTASAQRGEVGPYFSAGASVAFENFDLPRGVHADDSFALDLIGGYRVDSLVAYELEAEFLADFDVDGVGGGDIDGLALTGNIKLFPLQASDGGQPFLLLGLGLLELDGPDAIDADDTEPLLQIGGGLDFPISERAMFGVKATYRLPLDDLDDFEYWTLGANVQYRF